MVLQQLVVIPPILLGLVHLICCSAVLCPAIGDKPNRIKLSYDRSIGGVTRFACTGSYLLHGVHRITCGNDGRWSNKEPICYSEAMVCGTCVCRLPFSVL